MIDELSYLNLLSRPLGSSGDGTMVGIVKEMCAMTGDEYEVGLVLD
jgi:hypothetical protein